METPLSCEFCGSSRASLGKAPLAIFSTCRFNGGFSVCRSASPFHIKPLLLRRQPSPRAYTQNTAPGLLSKDDDGGDALSNGDSPSDKLANALSDEENGGDLQITFSHMPFDVISMEEKDASSDIGKDMQTTFSSSTERQKLRLDAFDMERDFRRRPLRPHLDVDKTKPLKPAKPGKRQNIPPKAKRMILMLRDSPPENFITMLRRCTRLMPDRADWLYVIRFLREKEDKSMLLQAYNLVLLEPAFQAGERDYTNLMLVYAQLKNPEGVEQTLKVMAERQVSPDLVTFTVVIGMYGKLGNLDMVKTKFYELKLWGLVPDTLVYCAVIEAYNQLGHAREAEMLIEDMELAGLPLKIEIFISLIRGYGIIGKVDDAERVFQLMQLKLLYPERRSYSALMDAYTKDEDLVHAIQVFNNMLSVGIEPTDKALARLLIACQNKNMLGEATQILEKLRSKSMKFGTMALKSFVEWIEKLGVDTDVEQLSLEMEKRLRRKAHLAKKWSTDAYVPVPTCS